MFYSAQILSKKGPLGTCWLASWSQRGLKRNEVFNCSLPAAVDSIINPEAPLALRLSGQLLLGLVRLYLRKLQFLEEDAGLALRGLARNAAAVGGGPQVDLPDGGVAPEMAITLQDGGYDPMAHFVGNELFPSFETSLFGDGDAGGGPLSAHNNNGGASATVAQDISELFGSRWTAPEEDERYDVDGDAMERRFSTELERLRSQGVEVARDQQDMFFAGGREEAFSPVVMVDDELMAVPPEDLFAGPGPTPGRTPGGKTPVSAGALGAGAAPLPGLSDMRITPPSMPGAEGADLLPDFGAAATGGTSMGDGGFMDFGGEEQEVEGLPPVLDGDAAEEGGGAAAQQGQQQEGQQPAAAAARRRATGPRRRRPTVDSGRDGQAATTLPSDEIRRLLADRKPLMTHRGLRARRQRAQLPPSGFDVAAQNEAARESELHRPNVFAALAPELLELFSRSLTLPSAANGAAAGTPGSARRRRSSRGTVAEAEEAAAAAAAASVVEAEGAPGSSGAAAGAAAAAAAAAGEAGPAHSGGFTAAGGMSEYDGGPMSTGGAHYAHDEDHDCIEPADTQQQQDLATAAAAALCPAGPEDGWTEEGGEGGLGERRGRVPLQPVAYSGEMPAALGSIDLESAGGSASAGPAPGTSSHAAQAQQQATAFTKNTALVLDHLRREFAPSTGSKRRHPGSHGDLAADVAPLSLDSLLLGGSAPRGRLDAARWFYEVLLLRKADFVSLRQEEPYGDIAILPTPLLTSSSGVGAGSVGPRKGGAGRAGVSVTPGSKGGASVGGSKGGATPGRSRGLPSAA